jgi:hypothetical protein
MVRRKKMYGVCTVVICTPYYIWRTSTHNHPKKKPPCYLNQV